MIAIADPRPQGIRIISRDGSTLQWKGMKSCSLAGRLAFGGSSLGQEFVIGTNCWAAQAARGLTFRSATWPLAVGLETVCTL